MTGGDAVINIRRGGERRIHLRGGRGGVILACSAGPSATCSNFPAIPPPQESHRCLHCQTLSAFRLNSRRSCPRLPSRLFPITTCRPCSNIWADLPRRGNGKAHSLSPITWVRGR